MERVLQETQTGDICLEEIKKASKDSDRTEL